MTDLFFHQTAESLGVRTGDCVDAAFFPQINEFRQKRSVQLLLSDLRQHRPDAAAAILRGEIPEDAPAPARSDFESLWRALSARGGEFAAAPERFCAELCPALTEETVCLCIKVFEELGLVSLREQRGRWTARCIPDAGRRTLGDSALLRALERGEGDAEAPYWSMARHANRMAADLRAGLVGLGFEPYGSSPSNQQFFVVSPAQQAAFEQAVGAETFYVLDAGRKVVRFVTSWATSRGDVDDLLEFAATIA